MDVNHTTNTSTQQQQCPSYFQIGYCLRGNNCAMAHDEYAINVPENEFFFGWEIADSVIQQYEMEQRKRMALEEEKRKLELKQAMEREREQIRREAEMRKRQIQLEEEENRERRRNEKLEKRKREQLMRQQQQQQQQREEEALSAKAMTTATVVDGVEQLSQANKQQQAHNENKPDQNSESTTTVTANTAAAGSSAGEVLVGQGRVDQSNDMKAAMTDASSPSPTSNPASSSSSLTTETETVVTVNEEEAKFKSLLSKYQNVNWTSPRIPLSVHYHVPVSYRQKILEKLIQVHETHVFKGERNKEQQRKKSVLFALETEVDLYNQYREKTAYWINSTSFVNRLKSSSS